MHSSFLSVLQSHTQHRRPIQTSHARLLVLLGDFDAEQSVARRDIQDVHWTVMSVEHHRAQRRRHAELIWAKANNAPSPEAIAAAKNADAVIAVVGITSQLEGEEMPVTEPGFLGGDRTSIDLPQPEEELVEAVSATGKPLVVVLMNGSALSVNWINDHANAILEA